MASGTLEDLFGELDSDAGAADRKEEGVPVEPLRRPRSVEPESFVTRVKVPEDKSGRTEPRKSRGTADERKLDELSGALEEKFAEFFGLLTFALPVTGVYGVENSDKATRALISIAKRRPKVMKALEHVADGVDALELGRFVVGVTLAVQVDFGRIPGDTLACEALGVTDAIRIMEAEDREQSEENPNVMVMPERARVRFQPVN
jgi:hypothetical protein